MRKTWIVWDGCIRRFISVVSHLIYSHTTCKHETAMKNYVCVHLYNRVVGYFYEDRKSPKWMWKLRVYEKLFSRDHGTGVWFAERGSRSFSMFPVFHPGTKHSRHNAMVLFELLRVSIKIKNVTTGKFIESTPVSSLLVAVFRPESLQFDGSGEQRHRTVRRTHSVCHVLHLRTVCIALSQWTDMAVAPQQNRKYRRSRKIKLRSLRPRQPGLTIWNNIPTRMIHKDFLHLTRAHHIRGLQFPLGCTHWTHSVESIMFYYFICATTAVGNSKSNNNHMSSGCCYNHTHFLKGT